MNKKSLSLVALAIFCLASLSLSAQDYAKPTPPANTSDGPHDYSKDPYNERPKVRIISFGFFSPLVNHLSFGYDQILGTDLILSTQIGIIGVGVGNQNTTYSSTSEAGAFVEAGVKLFFSPEFVTDSKYIRYNKMQGGYFKPLLVFSSFNEQQTSVTPPWNGGPQRVTNSATHTGSALLICFGKQWILANVLSLDMYAGMGYGLFSDQNSTGTYYSYLQSDTRVPLAFTAGLN